VKWTVDDSIDPADGVLIEGYKIMVATRDDHDTFSLCDVDSDCGAN
jgi:hypothetical protein